MCSSETISSKKPKESSVCESRLEFLHSLGRLLPDAPPDTCRSGWNKLAASCL
jgi:hypothetical protein